MSTNELIPPELAELTIEVNEDNFYTLLKFLLEGSYPRYQSCPIAQLITNQLKTEFQVAVLEPYLTIQPKVESDVEGETAKQVRQWWLYNNKNYTINHTSTVQDWIIEFDTKYLSHIKCSESNEERLKAAIDSDLYGKLGPLKAVYTVPAVFLKHN